MQDGFEMNDETLQDFFILCCTDKTAFSPRDMATHMNLDYNELLRFAHDEESQSKLRLACLSCRQNTLEAYYSEQLSKLETDNLIQEIDSLLEQYSRA